MPGMTGRMSTVIKAKISRLLDKAEDPGETLDYSYQTQLESLQNVKKGIADVVTAKKRLQMQSQKLEQSVVKLDTQARQALAAGNEELAKKVGCEITKYRETFSSAELRARVEAELGLPVEAKEAAAFALLAWQTWHHLPGNIPSATGASRPVILGQVTYA